MTNLYEELSTERKRLQQQGAIPSWYTTTGYQLFLNRYQYQNETVSDSFHRMAAAAASYRKQDKKQWEDKFLNLMWNGWVGPATPNYNLGTPLGMAVSCSNGYVEDSIDGFFNSYHEMAMLTKESFGTSNYLGDIRPRGSLTTKGFKVEGVKPVIESFIHHVVKVSQGAKRRGSWAGYLPIDHGDFHEIADFLRHHPDDLNMGWCVSDAFIARLNAQDQDAIERFQKALLVRTVTGKGYFYFTDKVSRMQPDAYRNHNLVSKSSNLCNEISLFQDKDHTFTCILSSMNLAKYDEWKDTDAVHDALVWLDCICEDFIQRGSTVPGFEKAIRFTVKGRALGLGVLGYHTYLQNNQLPFDSIGAHLKNTEIFTHLGKETRRASQWLAKQDGEPEWCVGTGRKNTHLMAIAPTTSNAILCGGPSQSIEPYPSNVYNQQSAGGEMYRINPKLLEILALRGIEFDNVVKQINKDMGSVRNIDGLTDEDKLLLRTAYEIPQEAIINQANARSKAMGDGRQGQSLNLFFSYDATEEEISRVTQYGFLAPEVGGLYYQRNKAGVVGSTGECIMCE